jgi:hypothetical protein
MLAGLFLLSFWRCGSSKLCSIGRTLRLIVRVAMSVANVVDRTEQAAYYEDNIPRFATLRIEAHASQVDFLR